IARATVSIGSRMGRISIQQSNVGEGPYPPSFSAILRFLVATTRVSPQLEASLRQDFAAGPLRSSATHPSPVRRAGGPLCPSTRLSVIPRPAPRLLPCRWALCELHQPGPWTIHGVSRETNRSDKS